MIYVHRLMGDGAPGEADPKALSPASRSIYAKVVSDAERYAGPYKVKATLPDKLVAGKAAELTVEVLTSSGRRVPNVDVQLSARPAPTAAGVGEHGRERRRQGSGHRHRPGQRHQARRDRGVAAGRAARAVRAHQGPVGAQRAADRAGGRRQADREAAGAGAGAAGVATQICDQSTAPGSAITDTVKVTGLAGQTVTIQAALYGPYAAREAITCADAPVWTGTIEATGDGDYVTAPVKLDTPGYYTYRESIAESDTIAAVETACAEAAETTVIRGTPSITTQISAQETAPGAQITDSAVVTGLGKLAATVNVELWGPFPTREAITCEGTPFWTGTFPAAATARTRPRRSRCTAAGYYTYRESIAATEAYAAVVTNCGEVSETTLAKAAPQVSTVVSDAVVRPGAQLSDTLNVTGLGKTPATRRGRALRPVRVAGGHRLRRRAVLEGHGRRPTATARTPRPRPSSGASASTCSARGSPRPETVAAHQAECQVEAETSLAAPAILGGRGDDVAYVAQGGGGPSKVKLARLGIDAPVSAIGIDMKSGALGIPENIKRVGWWRDGATPGDETARR